MKIHINTIGYAAGIGANKQDCADGPAMLQRTKAYQHLAKTKFNFNWQAILKPLSTQINNVQAIANINNRLAKYIQKLVCDQLRFLVFASDHTSAIGTWSGAQTAIQTHGTLGLIWIDAHMDSHTFATTQTGNIHGMPLACLLGHGAPDLSQLCHPQPKLLAANVCLIGVRSFEAAEAKLLEQLKVRVYFIEEIKQRGLQAVLAEARAIVNQDTVAYGLSIDMDAIDPVDAPGVNLPTSNGLSAQELLHSLQPLSKDKNLLGVEIVEYNPHQDEEQRTAQLCCDIIETLFDTEPD